MVSVSWWRRRRDAVVLADVRWYLDGRPGRDAYGTGHLPGAVFVDLDRWLAAAASPEEGRHPLPDPAVFAAGMARLGIADGTTVVAYDDAGGTVAARLVWMLRVTGHPAALLDGGLQAYDGPLEQAAPDRPPAVFTPRPWPADRLARLEDAAGPGRVVLDARDRARYRGDLEPVDPRPGHIPGARSLPCRENLAADGTFLPGRPSPGAAGRGRRDQRGRGHQLLRLGRDRVPQPADAGARRPGGGAAVPGLLVPVQPHHRPRRPG